MKTKAKRGFTVSTAILLAAAIGLLLFSAIGGTMAALTYFSQNYDSRLSMKDIGVTLNENGAPVSYRDYEGEGSWDEDTGVLLANMLQEGEELALGKSYPESISVTNSGNIDEYVRVIIYKYWIGADGKKTDLSPELIKLNLAGNGWVVDETLSGREGSDLYKERTVLYYTKPLAVGESTPPLSDTLTIDNAVASKVRQEIKKEGKYTTITTIYEYDGVQFVLEAEVNGVQTHNAEDAILSAWGREVSVAADGTLSLD